MTTNEVRKENGTYTKRISYFLVALLLMALSCTPSVKQEDLYGTWKYTKVENPNQGTPNATSEDELKENDPSISFSASDSLKMIWGGKVLSRGTFKLEYPTIAYKEQLPGGTTRNIRFLIKKFANDEIVFETMEADAVRVTAKRTAP